MRHVQTSWHSTTLIGIMYRIALSITMMCSDKLMKMLKEIPYHLLWMKSHLQISMAKDRLNRDGLRLNILLVQDFTQMSQDASKECNLNNKSQPVTSYVKGRTVFCRTLLMEEDCWQELICWLQLMEDQIPQRQHLQNSREDSCKSWQVTI